MLLEKTLGVRLIERSTRTFKVTEVGRTFYEQCRQVVLDAEKARALATAAQGEPQGLVRMSCPSGMLEVMRPLLASFLLLHPQIRLQVLDTNAPVNLIEQRVDLAVRVRRTLEGDNSLTVRTIGLSNPILVACGKLAAELEGRPIATLANTPTLGSDETAAEEIWDFAGPAGETVSIQHVPRLACSDYGVLREAAMAGLGVALLPSHLCRQELADGRLVRVFQDWAQPERIVHLLFKGRCRMPAALRALIDHLAAAFERGTWEELDGLADRSSDGTLRYHRAD